MAVVLEGVDLVAILVCLVAIALLSLLLLALRPVFAVINATVGRIPGLGGITHAVQADVTDALQSAIDGTAHMATRLWNALEWSVRLTGEALHAVSVLAHQAFDYLAHIGVHDTIKAFLRPVEQTAAYAAAQVDNVGAEVVALYDYTADHIGQVEHAIAVEIPHDIAHAVDVAGAALGSVISEVEHTLLGKIGVVERDAAAIESQLAGEIRKLLGHLTAEEVAALLASIPAVALLVREIADEAGLGNKACREKVKGICGTDPLRWEQLLLGLAAVGTLPSLRELVSFAGSSAREAAGLAREWAAG